MVTFHELTRREAADFLERFQSETPQRLTDLRQLVSATGGPPEPALDLSPRSLEPLWDWALPRLDWREGWTPPRGDEPPRRVGPDELEPPGTLPSWFDPCVPGWAAFSAPTLWLVDGMARYLGECLVREVRRARWGVGRSLRRGYVHRNHPVVQRLPVGDECEPMALVANTARRALTPSVRPAYAGPVALVDVYRVWTAGPR